MHRWCDQSASKTDLRITLFFPILDVLIRFPTCRHPTFIWKLLAVYFDKITFFLNGLRWLKFIYEPFVPRDCHVGYLCEDLGVAFFSIVSALKIILSSVIHTL